MLDREQDETVTCDIRFNGEYKSAICHSVEHIVIEILRKAQDCLHPSLTVFFISLRYGLLGMQIYHILNLEMFVINSVDKPMHQLFDSLRNVVTKIILQHLINFWIHRSKSTIELSLYSYWTFIY